MTSHPERPVDGRLAGAPSEFDLRSMAGFDTRQRLKVKQLRRKVRAGLADMDAGKVVSGTEAFEIEDRELRD